MRHLAASARPSAPDEASDELLTTASSSHRTLESDGAWGAILVPPPLRYGHTAIYDPLRDRMVVFGGSDGFSTWALSLDGIPTWSELAPSGTPPPSRYGHSAIYDPVRDRMVVFGGDDGSSLFNDTWALSLDAILTWSELRPSGTPPTGREFHTAVYDPVRDRMAVFGGWDGSFRNDICVLSFAGTPAWSELTPSGPPPSGRMYHSAIYDPVRDRMVVFGGWDGSLRNDVCSLSFAGTPTWSQLAPSGTPPSGRRAHSAIYDPVRDRMVVFGGWDGSYRDDTWALSLDGILTWSGLAPSGTTPPGREGHTAVYDPVRDRMVVFGGLGFTYGNDTWALSLDGMPTWSELAPSGTTPSGREGHTAIYDPVRDRMVVFGGLGFTYSSDTWALSLDGIPTWSELAPSGTPPSERYGHTAIYDPVRDRMVVFGGYDGSYLNDTWVLTLAGTPDWSELAPSGTPPPGRYGHTAIYDPVRDRMVVFGGCCPYHNDTWALSLAGTPAWSELTPSGPPPSAREGHTAVYDPVRDRMVVVGGCCPYNNDAWALSLDGTLTWSELAPSGTTPSGLYGHTAIYDPVRDRMVVFGGWDGSYDNETWALSLAGTPAWSQLMPSGPPPFGRMYHTAIYDPVRDRMVVFGGYDGFYRRDTWGLTWAWLRDLSIGPADITLTPSVPGCGDTVGVCAYVHTSIESGGPPVAETRVRIYDGEIAPAREIHADTLRALEGGSITPVCFSWLPPPDTSSFHLLVVLDADEQVPEIWETNNLGEADLVLGLEAPAPLEPADGSIDLPASLSVTWSRADCAEHYRLQVSRDSMFASTVLDQDLIPDTTLALGPLPGGIRHFWRVRSYWPPAASDWSEVWDFATAREPVAVVYPGDANSDGMVDARDVLPIGRFFELTGPPRPDSSLSWVGQPLYTAWSPSEAAHADCDGDGTVTGTDVLGIVENWNAVVGGVPPPGTDRAEVCLMLLRAVDQAAANPGLLAMRAALVEYLAREFGIRLEYRLEANAPDPFRSATSWRLTLPATSDAELSVYDVSGKLVWRAVLGSVPPGTSTLYWNGATSDGRQAPAGIYFYRFTAGPYQTAGKMAVVR